MTIIKYGEGVINEVNNLEVCGVTINYLPGILKIDLNNAEFQQVIEDNFWDLIDWKKEGE